MMSKAARAWKRHPKSQAGLLPPLSFPIFLPSPPLGQSHMPHSQLGLESGLASEGHEAQKGQQPAVR